MFVDKVVLEGTSSAVSTGAQGAAVVMRAFAKWDVELEIAVI